MRIDVVTIFPEYLAPLRALAGRARPGARACSTCGCTTCATAPHDRHRTVDDTPAGGGAGMVMRPEPWGEALDAPAGPGDGRAHPARAQPLGPAVRPGDGRTSSPYQPWLAFACGRYEGIDERVLDDAATRHARDPGQPGRLRAQRRGGRRARRRRGGRAAAARVSWAMPRASSRRATRRRPAGVPGLHQAGRLAGARGARGAASGHHARIARWRREQRLRRTARRRPDLLAAWLAEHPPTAAEQAILAEEDERRFRPPHPPVAD